MSHKANLCGVDDIGIIARCLPETVQEDIVPLHDAHPRCGVRRKDNRITFLGRELQHSFHIPGKSAAETMRKKQSRDGAGHTGRMEYLQRETGAWEDLNFDGIGAVCAVTGLGFGEIGIAILCEEAKERQEKASRKRICFCIHSCCAAWTGVCRLGLKRVILLV